MSEKGVEYACPKKDNPRGGGDPVRARRGARYFLNRRDWEWDTYTAITVDIKRSAQQVWHPIGRTVILQAHASDWDKYRYMQPCSEWQYVHNTTVFNYSWSGSAYLVPPLDASEVAWWTIQYTPEQHTIEVTVDDDLLEVIPPDTGSRDDSADATDSENLGAFDVKASLTVSGTNRTPFTTYTW